MTFSTLNGDIILKTLLEYYMYIKNESKLYKKVHLPRRRDNFCSLVKLFCIS